MQSHISADTPTVATTTPNISAMSGQHRRRGWAKVTTIALLVCLGVGSLFAWRATSAKKDEKKPDAAKIFEFSQGDVAALGPQSLGLTIPVSGSVRPVLQAMVKSKVSGEVSQVHVREGERVVAGQVLVSIDAGDLRARHETQQAGVAEAKARLDLARKNEQNNRLLLSKNFISQTAFDSVANSVEVAEANVKSAVAQAAITQRALSDAQIRAPFAGIVAKRTVNIGEKVAADMPVVHVVDLSKMELEAPIPVSDIPSVQVGQEIMFTVDGFADRPFKGRVERINPSAEAGSRSISVFVTLPNADAALKGGMFANGTLAAKSRNEVNAVPIAAVIEEGGQTFVYGLNGDTVERRPVTVGAKSVERGLVEIRDGLAVGTKVLLVKADGLKHGVKASIKAPAAVVTPTTSPAAPAALAKS
jgi:membrane fusion protein (multidrug efflux system)